MTLLPANQPSKVSPMMNQADQQWNMGESPDGRDVGGVLGQDQLQRAMPSYVALLPTGGWEQLGTTPPLVHYVGSFRPPGQVLGPLEESRASFHVVAPDVIDTPQVVVAIFTQATFGGENPLNPHVYPGDPNYYDLYVTGGVGPHVEVVKRNLARSPVPPFRVVGVQFVPRTSQRPMVSVMQRLRQVRRAVLHLLEQRYSIEQDDVAFAVDCASFGGFTAQVALVFYPTEFHAGVAGAFSGAHRSMPSDFDSHVFSSSLLGYDGAPHSYLMRDTVEIPMWCHIEQTDFASISTTNRWAFGHMQRPIYFLIGDEDTVTHGTDWIRILAGPPDLGQAQPQSGFRRLPNVLTRNVDILWSIVSKSAHGEHRPNVFTLEGVTPPVQTDDLSKPLEVMLDKAHAELNRTLDPPVVPIDDALIGRRLTATNLPSLDPSRAALAHKGTRTFANGTMPGLLTENSSFKRYGQGTWLGANESLKVKRLGTDAKASVFVGSADGYVTRLMMEDRGTSPVIQPFVEKARTNINGTPYALGHGTWGLDVGEVDDSLAGDEVVVTSYNRVALFDAVNLNLIREVTLLNWEYDNPRKVQVADLFFSGGGAIVFRTLHGHLVIMDKTLAIRYEHDEGGVIDLVIGPQPQQPPGNWLKRPIYLLSARGHVVRLEINTDPQNPPPPPNTRGRLAAASYLEYGGLRDLDVMPWLGQERLAALVVPHVGTTDAVRFFAPSDCAKVGQFGDLMHDPPPDPPPPAVPLPPMSAQHISPAGNQEPSFAYVAGHGGGDRYVISCGGDLSVWDGEMILGHKRFTQPSSFRPALGQGCVQAGDIDPATPGDEVVVSTVAGKVIWFKLSDLTTAGMDVAGPDFARSSAGHFFTDGTGVVYEHRCNMSLGATWAMAAQPANGSTAGKLRAVDAAGAWWEVSPTGIPTWIREGFGLRSLVDAKASSLPNASHQSGERSWETLMAGGMGALFSTPYVPLDTGVPAGPWWLPTGVFRPFIAFEDGHWRFPSGGVRTFDAGTARHWCAWWYRQDKYPNLIQCASYTVTGGMVDAQSISIWGSTQGVLLGNVAPPRWPPGAAGYLPPLRTEKEEADPHSMLGIEIGRVLSGRSVPQVVAAGMGGRVMLLDGNDGKIIAESADLGLGGVALAVADLTGDGLDEVLFAPLYSPIAHTGGTVRSHLHVLSGASGTLVEISVVPVGDPNNDDFLGYGACGITVADIPGTSISKAIFVTTLNGELVVFGHTNGIVNQILFRKVVEGSLGAFNSIVIDDLEPDASSKPEVYLAGSYGIRRFDFP